MDAKTDEIKRDVQEYYGKVLRTRADLKTGACCADATPPPHLVPLLQRVHAEVQEKFYGCATLVPPLVTGKTILDLGCGSGRDCYLYSQMVGPEGKVIGVDMTDEQLAVARKHVDHHTRQFGYAKPNVDFRKGCIEDLKSAGAGDASVDVVVSNCVINLSPDKEKVFSEIYRVLKPGGELYFSDVFAGRRIPDSLRRDPVLLGECLGGALYTEDFRRIMRAAGFLDFRLAAKRRLTLDDSAIENKAGMIDFYSMTVRAFKCDFEDICENYGHVAYYLGGLPESPHAWALDDHHLFKKGQPVPVCGNTAKMLTETRYRDHFKVIGDFSVHYGPFPCGPAAPAGDAAPTACC